MTPELKLGWAIAVIELMQQQGCRLHREHEKTRYTLTSPRGNTLSIAVPVVRYLLKEGYVEPGRSNNVLERYRLTKKGEKGIDRSKLHSGVVTPHFPYPLVFSPVKKTTMSRNLT